jgi:ribitol-5-phosphate 2-dehydrogenase
MLNTIYRLTAPRQIEAQFNDIDICGENVIVRPTRMSICKADQRYYQGERSPEILKRKLPMALIHESIGEILYDARGEHKPGDQVVLVPNTPVEKDDIIDENYLRSSRFRGSGFDGFMQDCVAVRRDRVLPLPDGIDLNVAAFTELVSVSWHTINRMMAKSHARRGTIGVWGDGNVAFITALLVKKRMPDSRVIVFGKHDYKMEEFIFADDECNISEIPDDLMIDHAFECVGGESSGNAVNQIIDHIQPQGSIALMGVSENTVPLNTRMILEKGLTVFGSSRSGVEDFRGTLELYRKSPDVQDYLGSLIGRVMTVRNISDIQDAFDSDMHMKLGKTVILWDK